MADRLMPVGDVAVTSPDSVELARALNDIGILHYLQNNPSSVSHTSSSIVKKSVFKKPNRVDFIGLKGVCVGEGG